MITPGGRLRLYESLIRFTNSFHFMKVTAILLSITTGSARWPPRRFPIACCEDLNAEDAEGAEESKRFSESLRSSAFSAPSALKLVVTKVGSSRWPSRLMDAPSLPRTRKVAFAGSTRAFLRERISGRLSRTAAPLWSQVALFTRHFAPLQNRSECPRPAAG